MEAENTFMKALESHTVMGELSTFTSERATTLRHNFNAVKSALNMERWTKWLEHMKTLAVQGHNLALAAAEKQDLF